MRCPKFRFIYPKTDFKIPKFIFFLKKNFTRNLDENLFNKNWPKNCFKHNSKIILKKIVQETWTKNLGLKPKILGKFIQSQNQKFILKIVKETFTKNFIQKPPSSHPFLITKQKKPKKTPPPMTTKRRKNWGHLRSLNGIKKMGMNVKAKWIEIGILMSGRREAKSAWAKTKKRDMNWVED